MASHTESSREDLEGPASERQVFHLQAGGTSVVLSSESSRIPYTVYWGPALGDLPRAELSDLVLSGLSAYGDTPFDVANHVALVAEHASAWTGRPGLEGSRSGGRDWSTAFRVISHGVSGTDDGGQRYVCEAEDPAAGLSMRVELQVTEHGLVRLRAAVTNLRDDLFVLGALRVTLPVPSEAEQLLDFTGRHTMERVPQRRDFSAGVHSREVRTGRTGLDSVHVLAAGQRGFGFRLGQVWAVHLAWSGNQAVYAERLYNGARLLGGGEHLEHGELTLARDETYRTPWLYGNHGVGLDALAERFHRHLRARATHPTKPRPVILNTWEAVYFDQRLETLKALADAGARVGVERFVLDDGWFSDRRNDTTSLGDWTVSREVWPDGLTPLIDHVRGLGMEFGLWVEPEMVSLDSHVAREHPEWVFSAGGRVGLPSRYQHVLDLGHVGAYEHVLGALDSLLDEYDISYLKWDHNRYLNDAGHTPLGEAGVHDHTLAVYRLMDELKAAHPGLEIEACAAGGGRIDLGVLEHTDRVWASDCIDPLERQQIQRYTQLLLPPELMGTHVGAPESHTTRRHHALSFRAQTAIWGHMGIEWDLTKLTEEELDALGRWVALHKQLRPLLHHGTVVTVDHPDPQIWISGVVSQDRSTAVFGVTSLARSVTWPPGRARLTGLDPAIVYSISVDPLSEEALQGVNRPAWIERGLTLSGGVLMQSGVELIPIFPEHSYLLRLEAKR